MSSARSLAGRTNSTCIANSSFLNASARINGATGCAPSIAATEQIAAIGTSLFEQTKEFLLLFNAVFDCLFTSFRTVRRFQLILQAFDFSGCGRDFACLTFFLV